jgi:hypothetical protein
LKVSARFWVKARTDASDVEMLTERLNALSDAKSEENSRFSTALGPSMQEAEAEFAQDGVVELSKLSEALETQGVEVLSVDAPTVVMASEATSETANTDVANTENDQTFIAVVAALLVALCIAGVILCCVVAWKCKRGKKVGQKVVPLPFDSKQLDRKGQHAPSAIKPCKTMPPQTDKQEKTCEGSCKTATAPVQSIDSLPVENATTFTEVQQITPRSVCNAPQHCVTIRAPTSMAAQTVSLQPPVKEPHQCGRPGAIAVTPVTRVKITQPISLPQHCAIQGAVSVTAAQNGTPLTESRLSPQDGNRIPVVRVAGPIKSPGSGKKQDQTEEQNPATVVTVCKAVSRPSAQLQQYYEKPKMPVVARVRNATPLATGLNLKGEVKALPIAVPVDRCALTQPTVKLLPSATSEASRLRQAAWAETGIIPARNAAISLNQAGEPEGAMESQSINELIDF